MDTGSLSDLTTWKYTWTNIKYSDARFDFRDVKLILNNGFGDIQMMKVDFPALKEWKIDALQTSNQWFLPKESYVELEFTDFDINLNTQLELLENGNLKPSVFEISINFGNSYFYHENAIVSFVMGQFVEFAIVVIENATYFVGQYIFSSILTPMLSTFTSDYQLSFSAVDMLPGQDSTDQFVLDWRSTHTPYIGDGFIDMFVNGNLIYDGQTCDIKQT